ncbi:MAG TPA: aa3-type cytochrome c oxidase subunit IV [Beijerinckiaceae bacterium]
MTDTKHAPHGGYSPDMDGEAHERMYARFLHFTTVGVFFALGCVAGLAVGGIRHAWFSAVLGIIVVHIAAAIGLFAPSLKWKPGAAALALMIAMLLFYG